MKRHSSRIGYIIIILALMQHLVPLVRAGNGEHRELWTGSLYSSTYRAGICIRNDGGIYGALYLRQANGAVDRYTITGKLEGDRITARHASGHEFKGRFVSGDTVQGELTLKSGHKLNVRALRGPEPEVDEFCRLARQQ